MTSFWSLKGKIRSAVAPGKNLESRNWEMSTGGSIKEELSFRTNAAIALPTAGASVRPCPLNPVHRNRPSIPLELSNRSIIGCRSGVDV